MRARQKRIKDLQLIKSHPAKGWLFDAVILRCDEQITKYLY